MGRATTRSSSTARSTQARWWSSVERHDTTTQGGGGGTTTKGVRMDPRPNGVALTSTCGRRVAVDVVLG
eukprot:4711415-Prymnesium_polylepis.1